MLGTECGYLDGYSNGYMLRVRAGMMSVFNSSYSLGVLDGLLENVSKREFYRR